MGLWSYLKCPCWSGHPWRNKKNRKSSIDYCSIHVGIYLLACTYILIISYSKIPSAISLIFSQAFSPDAAFGGFLGVLIIGVKRAVFSNEAELGPPLLLILQRKSLIQLKKELSHYLSRLLIQFLFVR